MKARFYNIEDQDALEAIFGEDSPSRPLATLGKDIGELIFEGDLTCLPVSGDTVVLEEEEFNVICSMFYPESDSVEFYIHPQFYVEVALS